MVSLWKMSIRKAMLVGICCLVIGGLTGCNRNEDTRSPMKAPLKIMYWSEDELFRKYGELFQFQYPYVEIEVVSTSSLNRNGVDDEIIQDFIEKEQPDIVVLGKEDYGTYVEQDLLMDLTPLIKRDKYDIDTIFPGMIKFLKETGGGKLYGLSPTFDGHAVIYNADLFEKYGIPFPRDGMTWEELFELAGRFPVTGDEDSRVYGYAQGPALDFEMLRFMMGNTSGLQLLNSSARELTLDTPAWRDVFRLALEATESNAILMNDNNVLSPSLGEEYYSTYYKPFLMGRVAMTTSGTNIFSQLNEIESYVPDYKPFTVRIAAGPVDPAEPNKTREISRMEVFSINESARNVDAAWEFIKFINGEIYAKAKSRTLNEGLLSRMNISMNYKEYDLGAYYKLEPRTSDYVVMEGVTGFGYTDYLNLQNREIALVREGKKSLDEALRTIQEEGQATINRATIELEKAKDTQP